MDQQQHNTNNNNNGEVPVSIPTINQQLPKLEIYHTSAYRDVKNNGNGSGAENGGVHRPIHYRECLKNQAVSIGSHAVDGCGEFMAGEGEAAMKCEACGCHRNFHRREAEGEWSFGALRGPPLGGHVMAPESSHVLDGHVRGHVLVAEEGHVGGYARRESVTKKRFRTKFTGDQKEKMYGFAQRLGWRIQKQDEGIVEQFCNEVGVRRQVLKVWMHNNKHTMAKKS